MLIREAAKYGFMPEVCQAVLSEGRPISSTRIRELIENGKLEQAEEFLGRPFTFSGRVVHGDRRGRSLGFPTANLLIPPFRAMLPTGAYAAKVKIGGDRYNALANIGRNPTFDGERAKRLEVNIQDFDGDIYDKLLMVEFLHKLRDEVAFPSVDHLVRQLNRDREAAAAYW